MVGGSSRHPWSVEYKIIGRQVPISSLDSLGNLDSLTTIGGMMTSQVTISLAPTRAS